VDRDVSGAGVRTLALVLLVALAGCSSNRPAERSSESGMRQLRAQGPSGSTRWPVVFRWEGATKSELVRVHVLDEAERPILGIEAKGDHASAPETAKPLLHPGIRYQWRVARVDENGEEADASELTSFQVAY
jgi:transposase InsO family protein